MDLVLIADDFSLSTRKNDGVITLAHATLAAQGFALPTNCEVSEFNSDGDFVGADFLIWQDTFGSTLP